MFHLDSIQLRQQWFELLSCRQRRSQWCVFMVVALCSLVFNQWCCLRCSQILTNFLSFICFYFFHNFDTAGGASDLKDEEWETFTAPCRWGTQGMWSNKQRRHTNASDVSKDGRLLAVVSESGNLEIFKHPCVDKGAWFFFFWCMLNFFYHTMFDFFEFPVQNKEGCFFWDSYSFNVFPLCFSLLCWIIVVQSLSTIFGFHLCLPHEPPRPQVRHRSWYWRTVATRRVFGSVWTGSTFTRWGDGTGWWCSGGSLLLNNEMCIRVVLGTLCTETGGVK